MDPQPASPTDNPQPRPDAEETIYCPLSGFCPYAQDLPEHIKEHPIYLISTGDPVIIDDYLTPEVHDAVTGREYRCQAIDEHDGKAYHCAITQAMTLTQTAMRLTYQLWKVLAKNQTGEHPPPV